MDGGVMGEVHSFKAVAATAPSSIEAEQQLLGAIMLDNSAYHRVSHTLQAEHFYDPVHQRIFTAAAAMIADDKLVSPVTMKLALDADEGLRELGGNAYLVRMAGSSIFTGHVSEYAQMILDTFQRRTLLAGMESARATILRGGSISAAQGEIEAAGAGIALSDQTPPTISAFAAATKAVDRARAAYNGDLSGIRTGIPVLDNLTGGLQGGDLIVIPAAPAMGKTAVALCMAIEYAKQGLGVAFVSLEMGDVPLADRIISNLSGVPYQNIARGDFTADDGRKLAQAALEMRDWPLEIVQSHVRTADGIYSAVRKIEKAWAAKGQTLDVVFVDYLQLIEGRGNSRAEIVTNSSVSLKGMAARMNIPVVALAQINNKALSDRDDKMPRLADIRESGQIEQDASLILFVHREHFYLERFPPRKDANGAYKPGALTDHYNAMQEAENKVEVFLAKNRHGVIGRVMMGCALATNRIWDEAAE